MREPSRLTRQQLLDKFFLEYRVKILDLAAFLDRLDQAEKGSNDNTFMKTALRKSLEVLTEREPSRIEKILMILSDTTEKPLEKLDRKSAYGAVKGKK